MSSSPEESAAEQAAAAMNAALDRVRVLLAQDARSWAEQLRNTAALMDASAQAAAAGVPQFLQLEVAGSFDTSQITATRLLEEAQWFTTALPRTLGRLETGLLLRHQAQVLLQRTKHCAVHVARAVEDEVLAHVLPDTPGLCPTDLHRLVDKAILRIESEQTDPAAAEQRHAAAVADRRTFTRPEQDGMGMAGAILPAEQLVAWQAALDALERRERRADRAAGTDRTSEQRRADIFAALPAMALTGLTLADTAHGTAHGTARAAADGTADSGELDLRIACRLDGVPWTFSPEQVAATIVLNVHVPVSTVLDLTREPGTVEKFGPISAEHVRLLRPASFRRVMVDADTGRPLAVDDRTTPADPDPQIAREQIQAMLRPEVITDTDEPQHDPSARLARLIDLRDLRCTGPGCSSTRCDRDHHDPWPTGPTSAANLGLLSTRCHQAKHHGWTLQHHPDGSATWNSPIHRGYDRPSPHSPPPRVDLYAQPPPLRPRPATPPPWWSQDHRPPDKTPQPRSEPAEQDPLPTDDPDEPPPF